MLLSGMFDLLTQDRATFKLDKVREDLRARYSRKLIKNAPTNISSAISFGIDGHLRAMSKYDVSSSSGLPFSRCRILWYE